MCLNPLYLATNAITHAELKSRKFRMARVKTNTAVVRW